MTDRPTPPPPTAPPMPRRSRPADRRESVTVEVTVGGLKLFLTVGEFSDGSPCELFIDVALADATMGALLNQWAILASQALQHGVPLDDIVEKLVFTRFDPAGPVRGHARIANATSPLDFVGRHLAIEYLGRDDLAHREPPEAL